MAIFQNLTISLSLLLGVIYASSLTLRLAPVKVMPLGDSITGAPARLPFPNSLNLTTLANFLKLGMLASIPVATTSSGRYQERRLRGYSAGSVLWFCV